MRILQVAAPAHVGGLERVVQSLAIGHHQSGHEVKVAMIADCGDEEHAFREPLIAARVDVITFPIPHRRYLRERAMMRSLCRSFRPDVVHSHGYRVDVVDSGVARELGIPTVSTAHGFALATLKNRAYEALQRRVLRRFEVVIAVSTQLADQLRGSGVPADRLHVVPNAWTQIAKPLPRRVARQRLGLPEDAFIVGWVGRVTRLKALDTLVDATATIADIPWLLTVLGDGPELARCQTRATRLGTSERIRWQGAVPEAGGYFRAFDVFVLSSRTEYCPIVLFEAMAADVPIVATAVGGVPDMLTPSEALLVSAQDATALANALRLTMEDPVAARARASAARHRLNTTFDLPSWLARHEALYQAAIDPRASGR